MLVAGGDRPAVGTGTQQMWASRAHAPKQKLRQASEELCRFTDRWRMAFAAADKGQDPKVCPSCKSPYWDALVGRQANKVTFPKNLTFFRPTYRLSYPTRGWRSLPCQHDRSLRTPFG